MSAMETNDLCQAIRSARIEGALLRSQQQGHKEGLEQGIADTERKFVLKLLKTLSPEEISKEYDVSLERINEIKMRRSI